MSIDINQVRALNTSCQLIKEKLPEDSVFEYYIDSAIYNLTQCSKIWNELRPGDYGQLEFDFIDW